MAVTKKDVEYIAALARLNFNDVELDKYTHHLNEILNYVGKLNELNTENVEPLSHPVPNQNVFRDDVNKPSAARNDALKNAPDKDGEHFKVPKVINQ